MNTEYKYKYIHLLSQQATNFVYKQRVSIFV